ncbi:MAG TPA: hypothetical protein VFE51_01945 [Verrucomicrobiae bacterium]|nr:hypothetical protein [Verrucomicrobiae bacterium]
MRKVLVVDTISLQPPTSGFSVSIALLNRMKPTICICCGEPMVQDGNALSRNPNVCACCSSLADGMDDSALPNVDVGESGALAKKRPVTDGLPAPYPAVPK